MYFCPPQKPKCGKPFSIELGARGLYTTNIAKIRWDDGTTLDFIQDLEFSANNLVGEIYGGIRVAPRIAVIGTFMIPVTEEKNAVLPARLVFDETLFAAGQAVTIRSTTALHRIEGEYFFKIGCRDRIGLLLMGEILQERLEVEGPNALTADKAYTRFMMGVGGTAEYAFSENLFGKVKGAYTFLSDQTGFFVEGQLRLFPGTGQNSAARPGVPPLPPLPPLPGMSGGARPYFDLGYRVRYSTWDLTSEAGGVDYDYKFDTGVHGPFAAVGIIF